MKKNTFSLETSIFLRSPIVFTIKTSNVLQSSNIDFSVPKTFSFFMFSGTVVFKYLILSSSSLSMA